MEKKAVLGIVVILLLASMFTLVLEASSIEASTVILRKHDDTPTTGLDAAKGLGCYLRRRDISHTLNLKTAGWTSIRYSSETENEYLSRSMNTRKNEISRSHFVPDYKWDISRAAEWRNFSYVSEDSIEFVIGINNAEQNSYRELDELVASNGGELVNTISIDGKVASVVVKIPYRAESIFVSKVEGSRLVRYIEPNAIVKADFVPNDPFWPEQWGPAKIEADYAWNITTGDTSVLVAVIDTGIDWDHPDLIANYVPLGYDWVNDDSDPMDDAGHGTHVAGTIAAAINNGIGIAGLANVRIMAEKVLNERGSGTISDVAQGIVHAVDQGAKIINLSLGTYIRSMLLHEAVRYAYDHGVLVIAAAGNAATSLKHYPAAFDEVVAVSATDEFDNPAIFTNYGEWVDVAAPGVRIYSTVWDDSYTYMSGTSMASPHVAGVAALIWSRFPAITRDQVWAQLQCSVDDLGEPGFDVYYGHGRVNARKAVEQAPSEHDVLVFNLKMPSYVKLGNVAAVNATIFNMGTSHESNITVQLLINSSVINSTVVYSLMSGASAKVSFLWNPTIVGTYNVTAYVVPVMGEINVRNNALSRPILVRVPQVIRVPSDYATIQDAINAAYEEDTIFVASGIYNENLFISTKGLRLIGEDRSNTTIDGGGRMDVVLVFADNVKIDGFTIQHSGVDIFGGIWLVGSRGNTISNTLILDNFLGIFLDHSSAATLRNNTLIGNYYNFGVFGDSIMDFLHDIDSSNTVNGKPVYYWVNKHDKQIPTDAGYVAVVNSTNIVVKDLNLTKNLEGLLFAYTSNSFIENVTALNNYWGAWLAYSTNNTIRNSTAKNNDHIGVFLHASKNNKLDENTVVNNGFGIALGYSRNNTLSSNEATNNSYGIFLEYSSYHTLRNNNMSSNEYGFGVKGTKIIHYIHDIDASNTIDGKPIRYLVNRQDLVIDSSVFPEIGYLAIINSTNIHVKNFNLSNNVHGILFAYTNGSTIENINATSNFWGILMVESSKNTISENNLISNKYGLDLVNSNDNVVSGNAITLGLDGIYLGWSSNNSIVKNIITGTTTEENLTSQYPTYSVDLRDQIILPIFPRYGLVFQYSDNNKVSRNTITSVAFAMYMKHCDNNNIVDNIITSNWYGLWLYHSFSSVIINNTISGNHYGLKLDYSGSSFLKHNNLTYNSYNFGVKGKALPHFIQNIDPSNTINGKPIYYLVNQQNKQLPANAGYVAAVNCSYITVTNMNVTNNVQGILFAYTINSTIIGNNVTANKQDGISLFHSDHNTIALNTIIGSAAGIDITDSDKNVIDSNTVSRYKIGIHLHFSDDNIVINNKVSGDEHSLVGIALTSARRNVVRKNEASYNRLWFGDLIGTGIQLESSSNENTINENTLTNNIRGLHVSASSRNTLSGNSITKNIVGVELSSSSDNALCANSITVNLVGVQLAWSSNNIVSGNNVSNNNFSGFELFGSSSNNTIYHNNFIDNPQQVIIHQHGYSNFWDDGYPSGGNFWSDYNGTDLFSGPYQNITGSDGIGDTPYTIDENNKDKFPYLTEIKGPYIYGDLNHDGKIDIRDIAVAARAFGSYQSHPRWNPVADINQDGKIDIRDLAVIAKNFGKTYL